MKHFRGYEREIELDELKVLQIGVLQAIDEFCEEHGIRYSLACGTLLGAVRHQGYIPWDDDIDIYLPREDYCRLIAEFPDVYKGKYKIASLERDSLWNRPYANAYNDETVFIENARYSERIGVNIDLFPVDDVPIGEEWEYFNKKRRLELRLFSLKFVCLDRRRSFIKNASLVLFRALTFFYSTRKWAMHIDHMIQQNNKKGHCYCFECCLGLLQKKPFPKKLFDTLVYVPFENRQFKAFADSDSYLKNGFGDYMKLPPKEKQISHHSYKAYWK